MAVNPIQLFTNLPGGAGGGEAEPDSQELRRLLAQLLARDDDIIKHPLQGAANLADTAFKGLAYQQAKAREQANLDQAADLYYKMFGGGGGTQKPNVLGPSMPAPPPKALQPSDPSPQTPMPPGAVQGFDMGPPPQGFDMGPGDPADALGMGALNKLDATLPPAPAPAPMPAPEMPAPAAPVPAPAVTAGGPPAMGGGGIPMGGAAPKPPPPVQFDPPEPIGSVPSVPNVPNAAPPLQMQVLDWAKQGPQGGMESGDLRAALAQALSKAPSQTGSVPQATAAVPPPQAIGSRDDIARMLADIGPTQVASLGGADLPAVKAWEPGSIVGPDLQMPTKAPRIPREAMAATLAGDLPDFRGRGGPASIRYNNPGAQYPGPSARRFGSIGTETIGGGHKIAVFPDAVSGAAAQFDLFANRYTGETLQSAIRRWSGGNSPGTYLKVIERETGLKPNTVLTREHLEDPAIAIPLAKAMSVQEAGRPYPMSDAAWQAAHSKAFGGTQVAAAQPPTERASYDLPQAPVQVADSSGGLPQMTREEFIKMYKNPYTRGFATELGKQRLKSMTPETTDDIKEYNLAKQQGYQGSFVDYMTTMKRSGATTITNDMRGERAEQIDIGKGAAGRANATMDRASSASDKLFQLSTLMEMQKRLPTDAMAQAKLTAGQWAKALGISESTLEGMGIGKDFIGDAQAFNSITSRMMVDAIGKGGFPANNFSNADRDFLLQTLPKLTNDPRGNRIIMEAAKRSAERDIEKARAWQGYRKANPNASYDDFELEFRDSVQRADIFGDMKREADDLLRATGAPAAGGGPPPAAVNFLKSNPTPEMIQFFEQKYGPGSARRVLGR